MSKFSERLIALRKSKDYSQEAIAAELGFNYRTYRRYESGETEPTLSTLIIIADFYDISLDDLAGRER